MKAMMTSDLIPGRSVTVVSVMNRRDGPLVCVQTDIHTQAYIHARTHIRTHYTRARSLFLDNNRISCHVYNESKSSWRVQQLTSQETSQASNPDNQLEQPTWTNSSDNQPGQPAQAINPDNQLRQPTQTTSSGNQPRQPARATNLD